jgi:D-alanyl-D-alanine carboxypeptidase (penicillin-binding protein 5/6)
MAAATATAAAMAATTPPAMAAASVAPPASLSARATTLIEQSTGQGLYGYAQGQEVPIASTTKLMTALITIEHAQLSDVFTEPVYYPAAVDSQIGLRPGERMTVHDLLLALLLPSADDAAEDLAYNVGHGSVSRFIGMMNARARELGLGHTHYSTPIGLDTPGNYSCAADLAKLGSFLLAHHPFFAHAVALPSALLKTGDHQRFVSNRNTLIGRIPWVTGVKTGHTRGAGYVLVGSGTRNGMTLVSAVLGTPSEGNRNADTLAVLDYGFAAFKIAKPVRAGAVLARLPIRDQPGKHADVVAARSLVRVIERGASVRTRLEIPHQLTGPLRRHAVVGSVVVVVGGRSIARIPLLVAHAVAAVSPLTIAARFVTKPSSILVLLLLLGAAVALAIHRRTSARARARPSRRAATMSENPPPAEPDHHPPDRIAEHIGSERR